MRPDRITEDRFYIEEKPFVITKIPTGKVELLFEGWISPSCVERSRVERKFGKEN